MEMYKRETKKHFDCVCNHCGKPVKNLPKIKAMTNPPNNIKREILKSAMDKAKKSYGNLSRYEQNCLDVAFRWVKAVNMEENANLALSRLKSPKSEERFQHCKRQRQFVDAIVAKRYASNNRFMMRLFDYALGGRYLSSQQVRTWFKQAYIPVWVLKPLALTYPVEFCYYIAPYYRLAAQDVIDEMLLCLRIE